MMKISVIIPTYQHASTLPYALDSLRAQSRKPDEIIVVDDGSTDMTMKVLKPYLDKIKKCIRQPHQGAPSARNRGFASSTGDFVIFWDADVVGQPHMLAKLERTLLDHPQVSWAYSSFWWKKKLFRSQPFDIVALRTQNYIHTTALIRRDAFPNFDESLKRFQDWDLWLTMSEQGKTGIFVDEPLYRILVRSDRPSYSHWLPKFMYHVPWNLIGWSPRAVRDYQAAREIITARHRL